MPIESSLYVPDSPKSWYNHFLYQISLHHIYINHWTLNHHCHSTNLPIYIGEHKVLHRQYDWKCFTHERFTKMRYTIPSPGILGDFCSPMDIPTFFFGGGGWLFWGGLPIGIPRWDWRYIPTIPPILRAGDHHMAHRQRFRVILCLAGWKKSEKKMYAILSIWMFPKVVVPPNHPL